MLAYIVNIRQAVVFRSFIVQDPKAEIAQAKAEKGSFVGHTEETELAQAGFFLGRDKLGTLTFEPPNELAAREDRLLAREFGQLGQPQRPPSFAYSYGYRFHPLITSM